MATTRFEIVAPTAIDAIESWERQYGRKSFLLACGKNARDITLALLKLKRPTKADVRKIIDTDGWTNVFCVSCHEYKAKVAVFGNDYPAEVCESCLKTALARLRRTPEPR